MGRPWIVGVCILCIALILSACSGGGSNAKGSGVLVVYSGRAQNLVGPIFETFEKESGIDVQVRYAGTPELAATIKEEGTRSPADVFYAQDPGGLGVLEDLFAKLPDDVLSQTPAWAGSEHGKWVGITARARTLVYNTKKLTEQDLPDDIWDLQKPEWKGRVGWAPTNASFQTMVSGMVQIWGRDKTEQWLKGMLANEPRNYPNNVAQIQAAADGEIDVGLVNHYYLLELIAQQGEGFAAANYHPRAGGPGALVMISGAGILATAKNKANGERFLRFMLSAKAQEYFAGTTYEYPVAGGVKPHPKLIPLDQVKSPDISMAKLADLAGTQRLLRQTGVLK